MDMNKQQFSVFAQNLLADFFVLFRDICWEEAHFDIGGDHEALTNEVFGDDDGTRTLIIYKRKGDFSCIWSEENQSVSEELREWLSKDVGAIYINMDINDQDEEKIATTCCYFNDNINKDDYLPDDTEA